MKKKSMVYAAFWYLAGALIETSWDIIHWGFWGKFWFIVIVLLTASSDED